MGPGTCHALPADLSQYDDIVRLVKELESKEKGEMFIFQIAQESVAF